MAIAVAAASLGSVDAVAQPDITIQAEALFREGKALMADGEYAAAAKLEASFHYEPATGTLLALALCHERQGKLASAWAEYLDTASRARTENRPDRERKARERASALEPRLSRLRVRMAPSHANTPGLVVLRNDTAVDPRSFGSWIPVDPGEYRLEARAPGLRAFRTTVSIQGEAQRADVMIPPLQPEVVAAPPASAKRMSSTPLSTPPPPGIPSSVPRQPPASTSSPRTLAVAGYVTGAVGIASLGVAAWFGVKAWAKNEDSSAHCSGNVCDDVGTVDRNDALEAAGVSSVGFAIGVAALAEGAAMVLLSPSAESHDRVGVSLSAGPSSAVLRGNF